MADSKAVRFAPSGMLALDPLSFGLEFILGLQTPAPPVIAGGAGVVIDVCGPLAYGPGGLFDTYDGILSRFQTALSSDATTVVVRYNTPGGEVAGAFDCARAMRLAARAAGKRVIAWCGAQACSAGYALASAADEIWVSDTAEIGSIGVIHAFCERTKADAAAGEKYAIITSGERKGDGNPHVELSPEAEAAAKARVMACAAVFWDLVKGFRGIEAAQLEANIFIGAEAVKLKLADRVATWTELEASIGKDVSKSAAIAKPGDAVQASRNALRINIMPDDDKKDDARSALAKAAEAGDVKAKKALAAYDAPDEADEKKKKEALAASAKAEDDKKEEEKKATVAAAAVAAAAASGDAALAAMAIQMQSLAASNAALTARADSADRTAFMASRPDLDATLVATLAELPLDRVKAIVAAIPVAPGAFRNPHVERTLSVTRGGMGDGTSALSPHAAALDAKMGIVPMTRGVVQEGVILHLGKSVPTASLPKKV